ncbi:F-box protein CPR1-like [Nicotiana tabacum]|uniref:F-box protein CPR1-like n=1 Tax=Nicotiana tabacum TaxID=4097 RepID=A0AC58SMD3_TOBAC
MANMDDIKSMFERMTVKVEKFSVRQTQLENQHERAFAELKESIDDVKMYDRGKGIEYMDGGGIDHLLNRRFVNPCNRLFLLAFPNYQIVLWNSAIKESRTIPRPIPIQRELHFHTLYRLGYVSSLDDYKIVRVGPPADIEIFSTKSNSWKLIGKFPSNYYFDEDMVVVDGIVYMISHILTEIKGFILCLCLKDESFQTIKYPNAVDDITIDDPRVWCMKKNGASRTWIKMLGIIVPDIKNIDRFWIQPVGFMKDGDILFLREYIAHDFVVYD